jgi:hypothetical protein
MDLISEEVVPQMKGFMYRAELLIESFTLQEIILAKLCEWEAPVDERLPEELIRKWRSKSATYGGILENIVTKCMHCEGPCSKDARNECRRCIMRMREYDLLWHDSDDE